MIAILRDWSEIGECVNAIEFEGLPLHPTIQKNWDHTIIRKLLDNQDRSVAIVDLGYGRGYTLRFLRALGFTNLWGIDLAIDWRLMVHQARIIIRERRLRPPYHIRRGSICGSSLPSGAFGVALSVSTLEHGVDIDSFMTETYRVLDKRGVLIVTTDYWDHKIDTSDSYQAFGLSWQIFDRDGISSIVESARRVGFELLDGSGEIPPCGDAPVVWQRRRYTFIALAFRKGPGHLIGETVVGGAAHLRQRPGSDDDVEPLG